MKANNHRFPPIDPRNQTFWDLLFRLHPYSDFRLSQLQIIFSRAVLHIALEKITGFY
jgi:hypothetical protein